MTTSKIRILLADDHALVRVGLRMVLDAQPDLEVVAEAGDGVEALSTAIAHDIDLAILDISMPRMTGLQAAHELRRQRPDVRVLILSMHDNEQYVYEALKAGASGYVVRRSPSTIWWKRAAPRCAGRPSSAPSDDGADHALPASRARRPRAARRSSRRASVS